MDGLFQTGSKARKLSDGHSYPIDMVEKTLIETFKTELKDTMIKIVPIPSNSQMAIEVLRWVKLRVSSKEYSTSVMTPHTSKLRSSDAGKDKKVESYVFTTYILTLYHISIKILTNYTLASANIITRMSERGTFMGEFPSRLILT